MQNLAIHRKLAKVYALERVPSRPAHHFPTKAQPGVREVGTGGRHDPGSGMLRQKFADVIEQCGPSGYVSRRVGIGAVLRPEPGPETTAYSTFKTYSSLR